MKLYRVREKDRSLLLGIYNLNIGCFLIGAKDVSLSRQQQQKVVSDWGIHTSPFDAIYSAADSTPPPSFFNLLHLCSCIGSPCSPLNPPFSSPFPFFPQLCWSTLAQLRKKGKESIIRGGGEWGIIKSQLTTHPPTHPFLKWQWGQLSQRSYSTAIP